jgi:hypothetical protein
VDPFALLQQEDPTGTAISSVLCQAGVLAHYSGAAVTGAKGRLLVEGKQGEGDQFMLGLAGPESLPSHVLSDVHQTNEALSSSLGPVRFEWVFDGTRTWIVQLHKGGTKTDTGVIVPGDAKRWVVFEVSTGLESLRTLLNDLKEGSGIIVQGEVGLTSHIADLLRKSKRPSKIELPLPN